MTEFWTVRTFAGKKGDALDPWTQTFRWDGRAATPGDAKEAALAAAATIWSVSATTLGKKDAPFPEDALRKTSVKARQKCALTWSIGPRLRAAIDALGQAERHAPAPAAHAIVADDLLALGIRALDAPPEAWVSGSVLMNEPRVRDWTSLCARAQLRGWTAHDLEPVAAEAMLALTVPRWLGAQPEGQYCFTTARHEQQGSATLRAGEFLALRRRMPDDVAFACEVLCEIGAPETAGRLRQLLDEALVRIAKREATT